MCHTLQALSVAAMQGWCRAGSSFEVTSRGPESEKELAQWDSFIAERLMERGLAHQAVTTLAHGVVVHSDYSGFDFSREAIRLAVPMLAEKCGVAAPMVKHLRSADWGVLQQNVLKKQARLLDDGDTCVMKDFSERMHPDAQNWIDSAMPEKSASDAEWLAANTAVAEFLDKNGCWVFAPDAMCSCITHNRMCPAYPAAVFQSGGAAFLTMATVDDTGGAGRKSQRVGSSGQAAKRPWWASVPEAEDKSKGPLFMSVHGLTCTDFTSLGKQKRSAGKTDRYHSQWRQERKQLAKWGLEDLYLTECSDRYPAEQAQAELEETHILVSARASPIDMGFPHRRKRSFGAGLNKACMVWTGPEPHLVEADFKDLIRRTVELTGDVYFVADELEQHQWLRERISKRKAQLPQNYKQVPMTELFHLLLPRAGLQRMAVYGGLRGEQGALNGSFLVDSEQNSHSGSVSGPMVPPLNTHTR